MQTTKTEADLLRLPHSTEHTFVERKTVGDTKDSVKTAVAFANTLPDAFYSLVPLTLVRSRLIFRISTKCRSGSPTVCRASIRPSITQQRRCRKGGGNVWRSSSLGK
jgi:hypothetical protein